MPAYTLWELQWGSSIVHTAKNEMEHSQTFITDMGGSCHLKVAGDGERQWECQFQ